MCVYMRMCVHKCMVDIEPEDNFQKAIFFSHCEQSGQTQALMACSVHPCLLRIFTDPQELFLVLKVCACAEELAFRIAFRQDRVKPCDLGLLRASAAAL